jgi:predicted O-methyltransferase YrrM
LNETTGNKIRRFSRLIRFLIHSNSRYGIHSPYVYDLIEKVIRSRNAPAEPEMIRQLRKKLLQDHREITKVDMGTGNVRQEQSSYLVTISSLMRKSTTPPRKAQRLYRLANHINARRILEFGTSLGLTTALFGLAARGGQVISMEGSPEVAAFARKNLDELGLDTVQVVTGRFVDILPGILNQFDGLDLVFFDGNHRKDATLHYFLQCLPLAHNETVFVLDDIHASEEMEQAWLIIKNTNQVKVTIDLFTMGLVFFRKELSKQDFKLRYL